MSTRPANLFHVSPAGDDGSAGTERAPLRSVSRAAALAGPGDQVLVHAGVYRERVDPPRGGESDERRIVFRAAPGERVLIKGSEVVAGWTRVRGGVWRAEVPNDRFGDYNPFADVIGTDWFCDFGRDHHTGAVYLDDVALFEAPSLDAVMEPTPLPRAVDPAASLRVWYAEVGRTHTTIHAHFGDRDPNAALVEINAREACFYPSRPHVDYLTVEGFHMTQAACQWSTATDQQNGLLGTHWSKGWIIQDNVVWHARNIGIVLGKDRRSGHRAWAANRGKTEDHVFNEVVLAALLASRWHRDHVGSHVVRRNTIFECEKNGIHSSLGGVFSTIEDNHVFRIHTQRQFGGADMAGIKLLAPIDVTLRRNHVHHAHRGIWLDWMVQGTRVSGNLLHDNDCDDLFIELAHGPFIVDGNLLLSPLSLCDWSQGGAFLHNYFAGRIATQPVLDRTSPYHHRHATMIGGFSSVAGGDHRFLNNLLVAGDLDAYTRTALACLCRGNVRLDPGAEPVELRHVEPGHVRIEIAGHYPTATADEIVSTGDLGRAAVSGQPFDDPAGQPVVIDTDVVGQPRDPDRPRVGPLESPGLVAAIVVEGRRWSTVPRSAAGPFAAEPTSPPAP